MTGATAPASVVRVGGHQIRVGTTKQGGGIGATLCWSEGILEKKNNNIYPIIPPVSMRKGANNKSSEP